jgi:transposase-like protein
MARKRHSDEDILKLLGEIELKLIGGADVASACRGVGISDATYYSWRKRFGGMGRAQLSELKSLEKENARLKSWRKQQIIRGMICLEQPSPNSNWTSSFSRKA